MVFAVVAGREFTEGEFYETTGSNFYASEDKMAGDYSPVRYRREIDLLRKFCPRGRVLDVGCSTGGFLFYLRERFGSQYEVMGTDVASGALEIAESKGIPVLREDFLSLSRGGYYDAISFWAVLEHVAAPGQFLRQARALLRPGGHCFTLVPNIRSLAVRVLGRKYRYILPQHLNYFSSGTLRRLIADSGFQVIYSTTTHFNPLVILQDFRSKTGLVLDEERAALLVKTNSLKTNPLLAPIRVGYAMAEKVLGGFGLADNVVLVGRKAS